MGCYKWCIGSIGSVLESAMAECFGECDGRVFWSVRWQSVLESVMAECFGECDDSR